MAPTLSNLEIDILCKLVNGEAVSLSSQQRLRLELAGALRSCDRIFGTPGPAHGWPVWRRPVQRKRALANGRSPAPSNGRAPKGGHRVEVVAPAAVSPNDDDLDLVFQEVDRMQVRSSQALCITKSAERVEQLRNAGVEANLGSPMALPLI